jgi:thiol:disulfide interchange protein DsbD
MAFPYLLLSAFPSWRHFIPKPGVWMERLKQFMGFPLLATNLWLLWVIQNQRGVEAVLLLLMLFLMLAFFAWVYGSLAARAHALVLLLVLLLAGGATIAVARMIQRVSPVYEGVHSPTLNGLSWTPFTPQALASLRAEGKPVLVDFTASWCLTCQFNERTAIDVPAVRQLLQQKGIVAMKGDWTNSDPAITEVLKSFGRVGVPLVVFYPEGKESAPIVLPELLTERIVLEALKN